MTNPNDPDVSGSPTYAGSPASRTSKFRKPAVITLAFIGGLALTLQVLEASAEPGSKQSTSVQQAPAAVPTPPAGKAWLQGAVTDETGQRLDNVNVEVWSNDPAATEPVASNLTYGGMPADGRHDHGVYRVEVPIHEPYRILFSAVGGEEDGDAYQMQWYGQGRPIMGRVARRGQAPALAPAIRNLGTTQLVHHGQMICSGTKAAPQKKDVKAGKPERRER